MGVSVAGELFRREDEQERRAARHASEQGHEEAEDGWQVGLFSRGDLVYGAESEALGQVSVELGEAESQTVLGGAGQAFHAGETVAQVGHDLGPARICGSGQHASGSFGS